MDVGVLVYSEGRVVHANSQFCQSSGYEQREILGKNPLDFVIPELREVVQQRMTSADEKSYITTGLRKDGSPVLVEVQEASFCFQNEFIQVAVVAGHENDRTQASVEFIGDLVHELRSPLTNLRMALQMLQFAPSPEQRQHYYSLAIDECDRELKLVDNLLDLSRLQSDGYQLQPGVIQLNLWLVDLLRSFEMVARERQQRLAIDLPPASPMLRSDAAILAEILRELLTNATKYTIEGGEILLQVGSYDAGVDFTLSNTAQIPASALPRLFDRFYRVPKGDPNECGGSGLGLAVVRAMVQLLGGEIGVTSQAGRTTFRVQIPNLLAP